MAAGALRVSARDSAGGEFFFREGEPGDRMYVLEEGSASIVKRHRGEPFVLRVPRVGECLGEMALIDLQPRSASVGADTPCLAITLQRC